MSCGCMTYEIGSPCQCGNCAITASGALEGDGTLSAPLFLNFGRLTTAETNQIVDAICASTDATMALSDCITMDITITSNGDGSWTYSNKGDTTLFWSVSSDASNVLNVGSDNGPHVTAQNITDAICGDPAAVTALRACLGVTTGSVYYEGDSTTTPPTEARIWYQGDTQNILVFDGAGWVIPKATV